MVDREDSLLKSRRRTGLELRYLLVACSVTLIGVTIGPGKAQLEPVPAAPSQAVASQSAPATAPASETPDTPQAPTQPPEGAGNSFSGQETNLSAQQLQTLVGRIAIYPDDLLGLVLTASTQPLQIVEAQRFLDMRKAHPMMKIPKTWDPSIIALLNYPDVIKMMDNDLAWTQQLGTSVIEQRAAVLDAIQDFRKQAYSAGNLRSNDRMTVTPEGTTEDETVSIAPANPQTIYVPTYDPAAVVAPAPTEDWSAYDWSPPYPYYAASNAIFFPELWYGGFIGFGFGWHTHQIFRGDCHWDHDRKRHHGNGDVTWRGDGRSRPAPGASASGRSIWEPDRGVIRQRPANITRRDLAGTRPANGARPGNPPRSTIVRPTPQVIRGVSGVGGRSPAPVSGGPSTIRDGAAMPPQVSRRPSMARNGTAVPPQASRRPSTTVPPQASRRPSTVRNGTAMPPHGSARPHFTGSHVTMPSRHVATPSRAPRSMVARPTSGPMRSSMAGNGSGSAGRGSR